MKANLQNSFIKKFIRTGIDDNLLKYTFLKADSSHSKQHKNIESMVKYHHKKILPK